MGGGLGVALPSQKLDSKFKAIDMKSCNNLKP